MGKKQVWAWVCERCEHSWVPRETTEGEPTICPKCKSPYWNKPRTKKLKNPRGKK